MKTAGKADSFCEITRRSCWLLFAAHIEESPVARPMIFQKTDKKQFDCGKY